MNIESSGTRYDRSLPVEPGRNLVSGALAGIGVAGFIDETIFHQLLHWHHFYDKSTPTAGLVSDGLFHAFSWFCVVGGLFLLADLNRRAATIPRRRWAGLCFGLGGFQLYDGTVQHKLMRLHQVRYHVNIVPYDLVWNVVALLVVIVGILLYRSSPDRDPATSVPTGR